MALHQNAGGRLAPAVTWDSGRDDRFSAAHELLAAALAARLRLKSSPAAMSGAPGLGFGRTFWIRASHEPTRQHCQAAGTPRRCCTHPPPCTWARRRLCLRARAHGPGRWERSRQSCGIGRRRAFGREASCSGRTGPACRRRRPWQAGVAITIDDGPDPEVTPQVLEQLDRHHGPARHFFASANACYAYPDLAQEIVRRGHVIENHSQRHRHNFSLLGPRRHEH